MAGAAGASGSKQWRSFLTRRPEVQKGCLDTTPKLGGQLDRLVARIQVSELNTEQHSQLRTSAPRFTAKASALRLWVLTDKHRQ